MTQIIDTQSTLAYEQGLLGGLRGKGKSQKFPFSFSPLLGGWAVGGLMTPRPLSFRYRALPNNYDLAVTPVNLPSWISVLSNGVRKA